MSSKQLDSILSRVPPATANNLYTTTPMPLQAFTQPPPAKEPTERVVAEIPKKLKEEVRSYLKEHPRETERTVILRALKAIGFNVDDSWLVDNRTKR